MTECISDEKYVKLGCDEIEMVKPFRYQGNILAKYGISCKAVSMTSMTCCIEKVQSIVAYSVWWSAPSWTKR